MKTFYHNITKGLLNETDISDFMEKYSFRDIVMYSVAGDATLHWLTPKEITELKNQYNEMHPEDDEDTIDMTGYPTNAS